MIQIRRGDRDISLLKHFCDPSLDPSRRGGSNEESQHLFFVVKMNFRK